VCFEEEVEIEDEPVLGKRGEESRPAESSKEAQLDRFAHFHERG